MSESNVRMENIRDYKTLGNKFIESDMDRRKLYEKKKVEAKIWCSFTEKSDFLTEDYFFLFTSLFINFIDGKKKLKRDAYSFIRMASEATVKRRIQKAIDSGFILVKGADEEWQDWSKIPDEDKVDTPTSQIKLADHMLAHCRLFADYASGSLKSNHPIILNLMEKLLAAQ